MHAAAVPLLPGPGAARGGKVLKQAGIGHAHAVAAVAKSGKRGLGCTPR
jgi:hypothetical protein